MNKKKEALEIFKFLDKELTYKLLKVKELNHITKVKKGKGIKGKLSIITSSGEFGILINDDSNYLVTSAVQNVLKHTDDVIEFETMNSIYRLRLLKK